MTDTQSPTEHMFSLLKKALENHPQTLMPPPCFLDMQGEVIERFDGQRLRVRFPLLNRYQNPWGYMQGGFVAAALDNTIGPFSFLIAPPNVTTQLQINYLRPITPDLSHIECVASLLENSGRTWICQGRVLSPDQRVLALAQASMHVV